MTPPNELEQLAEFQDAIQSDEGLERLRAMQYLQQMNNQGIMGLPQVRQQPVVQRDNGGPMSFNTLKDGIANTEVGETFIYNGKTYVVDVSVDAEGNQTKIPALRSSDQIDMLDRDITGGLDRITQEQIDAGYFTPEEAYRHNNYLRDLEDLSGNKVQREQFERRKIAEQGDLGGPVIERFNGGLTNLRGAEGLKETVNYMEEGTIQEANAKAMAENQPSFMFQNQLYETGTMTPIRENTEKGILDRATLGGVVETPNFVANLQPNPRYQYGPGSKITDTWGSNEPPQPVNLPIQSQDVTNTFMPTNMVEYTPPFYGGMAIPPGGIKPIMVPADEQGNPIMPFSKQTMTAEQGGYVLDLAGGGSITDAAQGLAGFGRYGDNMLVHMNPDEVAGLMSLGNLTINPVTGLPEAFSLKSFFRPIKKVVSNITKPIRKVVKSKAFKALAPLVLAVAAPYALGALAPSVFGAGATALGGALSTSGALGYGLATGLGSMAGNLLGGARFGDAARQGLMSGVTGGLFKGIGSGNWMGTGKPPIGTPNVLKDTTSGKLIDQSNKLASYGSSQPPTYSLAGQNVAKAPVVGENILADASKNPIWGASARGPATVANQFNIPQGSVTGLDAAAQEAGLGSVDLSSLKEAGTANLTQPIGNIPAVTADQAAQLAREPFTFGQKLGQIGRDIYKDYGNLTGAAKLVGMDLMQPDWDQVYANEASMEDQLQDMGYTIETGFDGQKVIRDSSGTVMPSNLSIQDILDRALGRTPRTRLVDRIGFEPNASQFAAQGGLVSLAQGGEFSGKVEGDGHGMEDNVYMPIVEKGQGQQIGTLAVSPSEYVVDAHTMSALGNGNADEGAKVMDSVIASVRKKAFGTTQQPKEIDGLSALTPMMERV